MKYTKDIPYTKNGVELPFEIIRNNKKKVYDRINYDITCPMNWLEEILDEIEPSGTTNTIPTNEFLLRLKENLIIGKCLKYENSLMNMILL